MVAARVKVLVVARPEQAASAYRELYKSLSSPDQVRAVGVDCEGQGQAQGYALMVQVSSDTTCIVEIAYQWRFSVELTKLLADASIAKVFCGAGGDVDALPTRVDNVIDVQSQVSARLQGNNGETPGLSKVLSFADPLKREWKKQKFGKNGWFRLKTGEMMLKAHGFVQYAAADAWGTLRAYLWLSQCNEQRTKPAKRKRLQQPVGTAKQQLQKRPGEVRQVYKKVKRGREVQPQWVAKKQAKHLQAKSSVKHTASIRKVQIIRRDDSW